MTLADTLYRVPRQGGLQLLQRRGNGGARELTSRRLRLAAGERVRHVDPSEESVLVLQEGRGTIEADGGRWTVSRRGVFDERATALYAPPGMEWSVAAET